MHPVLEIVVEHNIGHLVYEDTNSIKYFWMFGKKGEYSFTTFTADEESDFVEVSLEIKMRCQVATVRNRLYLNALASWLPESFTIGHRQPCTLLLNGIFSGGEASEDEILLRLLTLSDLSHTMVLATHLNVRLSEQSSRRGSEAFKKVLPSYLAALTVCSIQEGIESN